MIGVLRRIRTTFKLFTLGIGVAAVATGLLSAQPASAEERYAAFVIDALNGNVLFSRYADNRRYPASLTKIMTIYLMLEDVEAGRIRFDTPLKVSQNAANQAPSKIGVRPGETITVDQAIRALVTKSANDVAVVVAENLGGTVAAFALRMTRTAHAMGMRSTNFRNPHGLPDSGQYTTARDMATLAIQTQRRFPQYYSYFQTRSFTWKGRTYGNHNKLLGRVKGVDGMKTGYIRASGFNLVSSMRRDGRHIIGVVMGGRTGSSRDAHMRDILEKNIRLASTGGSIMFANAPLPRSRPDNASLPVTATAMQAVPAPRMLVPSTTVPGTLVTAGMAGKPMPLNGDAMVALIEQQTADLPPVDQGDTSADVPELETTSIANAGGWVIQIGAFNDRGLALDTLERAKTSAPTALASAKAFTETIEKNGETLWRARFAGFDRMGAEGACSQLKQRSFGCFPARN
ncbi:D-alanyl-D-alanine carboxypeptidase [Microbaculum marinisediminis]|uniref:D-alanyl-D-alanine carboxypeptidase n=1 Tax=Microbaculum marinisediminis TaxID=2931392 RepID=A0AAW5R3A6_9HYPH|nr:D-alanyl-D-alanine carboxypeptidase [Microbaculum sp. A6E488]MCT8973156.1 D-alanyl-D-alanine carboxypeptidase [Microbaculum sp. A6E488]